MHHPCLRQTFNLSNSISFFFFAFDDDEYSHDKFNIHIDTNIPLSSYLSILAVDDRRLHRSEHDRIATFFRATQIYLSHRSIGFCCVCLEFLSDPSSLFSSFSSSSHSSFVLVCLINLQHNKHIPISTPCLSRARTLALDKDRRIKVFSNHKPCVQIHFSGKIKQRFVRSDCCPLVPL